MFLTRRFIFGIIVKLRKLMTKPGSFDLEFHAVGQSLNGTFGTADYYFRRIAPRFHFGAEDIAKIVALVPTDVRVETVKRAESILRKEFSFRSLPPYAFKDEIDWSFSSNGTKCWIWDLNRHGFFADLAAAGFYTGDHRYFQGMILLWKDWIARNPVSRELAFYPMEVAIRLNNWIWAFHFAILSKCLSDADTRVIISAMWVHAHYLYWNLEFHWPNNHLMFQAKALLEFALLFPEFDKGQRFLRRSLKHFNRCVEEQILDDGVHSELCSMYHRCVSSELLELVALARRNSFPLGKRVIERIHRTTEFSRAIRRGDGTVPLFGDSAREDVAMRFEPGAEPKSWLNYWLWHDDPQYQSKSRVRSDGLALQLFSDAGYVVCADRSRKDGVHLTVDCGEFSRNPASDHAHCDALSFVLHMHGQPILIDAGVYYAAQNGAAWNQYFRGTRAHNTLMIDGREQSELWRDSDVKQTADVRLLQAELQNGQADIKASCIPFWGKSMNLCHVRSFRMSLNDGLTICDRVDGEGEHLLEWSFNFAPSLKLAQPSPKRLSVMDESGNTLLSLSIESDLKFESRIYRGSRDPMRGWASVTGVELMPIETAVISARSCLPVSCEFQLSF